MIRTIFVPFEWNCVLLKILSIRIMFMDNFFTKEKCVREVGQFSDYATQCGRSMPEEWAKYSRWAKYFFALPHLWTSKKKTEDSSVSDLNVEVRGFLGSCLLQ